MKHNFIDMKIDLGQACSQKKRKIKGQEIERKGENPRLKKSCSSRNPKKLQVFHQKPQKPTNFHHRKFLFPNKNFPTTKKTS